MQITKEDLFRLNACEEGVEEFVEMFPEGIDVPKWTEWCQTIILMSPLRKWLGWSWNKKLLPVWSLSGADLSGADLNRANLYRANLSGADLSGADLNRANLYRADLSGADLNRANLYGANLYGADLYGANLSGANLYGADLYGADLNRADLSGADRSESDPTIDGWIVNENNILERR